MSILATLQDLMALCVAATILFLLSQIGLCICASRWKFVAEPLVKVVIHCHLVKGLKMHSTARTEGGGGAAGIWMEWA